MAEGTSIVTKEFGVQSGKKVWFVSGVLSTDETLTVSDASVIEGAILLNADDNASDTCTVATNVITLTEATITDKTYTGIAWGY